MIRWLVILALAAAAIVPAPSQAQRCGDTLDAQHTAAVDLCGSSETLIEGNEFMAQTGINISPTPSRP